MLETLSPHGSSEFRRHPQAKNTAVHLPETADQHRRSLPYASHQQPELKLTLTFSIPRMQTSSAPQPLDMMQNYGSINPIDKLYLMQNSYFTDRDH